MEKFNTKPTTEELERRKSFHSDLGVQMRSVGLRDAELWNNMFPEWGQNALSPNISVLTAQRLSIVFTCLNVLGETRGSLPCEVIQNTDEGCVSVRSHPVYRLVHDRPNPYMTAFDFWATVEKLKKAWGNCYVEIFKDNTMTPVSLWIRLPWLVTLTKTTDGELYYNFEGRQIRSTDMLHFKNYSMNGLEGISTIKQNAITVNMGVKLKDYNSKIVSDRPWAFLTTDITPKNLQAKENMGGLWKKKEESPSKNAYPPSAPSPEKVTTGRILDMPLLYGGVKLQQLSLPADDVAYIESTNLVNTDIYGMFRVPPTFGQNYKETPYKGAEQQDLVFVKYSLASIRGDEQECTEKLFPEVNKTEKNNFYVKFNLKGLLAGDHASRGEFYTSLFNIGALNANDIREMEDMPHYKGGNTFYVQGALMPVDLMADFIQSKITQAKNKGQSKKALVAETKAFINTELKTRLNGHYKEVADLF